MHPVDKQHQSTWSPEDTPRNSKEIYTDIELDDEKISHHNGVARIEQARAVSISHEAHPLNNTGEEDRPWRRHKLTLRQRLHHFTWAWYTLTMSTGGISLLIFAQPFQFPGLRVIGWIFYISNLIMFVVVCTGMIMRFIYHKGSFGASLKHEREGFFFPTFWLSIATLITSTQRYVIPENDENLLWGIQLAFWAYAFFTFLLAVGQYSYVFAAHSFGLQTMMPTWILPIFPIMLTGTIASVIAETQPELRAVSIVVGGLTCQGLGLSVAFMMYAHMVGRLMQSGLPHREHRPGLYMCVGPPAFTVLALIGMANGLPENFDFDGNNVIDVGHVKTVAMIVAGFLWALSLWWFFIATIAVLLSRPKYFHLGWWAMVFPNTGFTLATISAGNELNSDGIRYVAVAMSIGVVIMYFVVLQAHLKAVWRQDIMYPGRDEDFNDH
ncbi:hypothetical protein ABW19_dt0210624 [Dactylella cylindrospora]|nr:hypothetical protein ABW19_dt0210624 [Dactylella cylindrospora]